jgi:hypothetical protein
MSERDSLIGRGARLREILRWFGRGYLAYHLLAASWIMVALLVDTRPGYLREPGALGELVFLIVLYPLAIPALIMWGAAQLSREPSDHPFGAGFVTHADSSRQRILSCVQFSPTARTRVQPA